MTKRNTETKKDADSIKAVRYHGLAKCVLNRWGVNACGRRRVKTGAIDASFMVNYAHCLFSSSGGGHKVTSEMPRVISRRRASIAAESQISQLSSLPSGHFNRPRGVYI